jgi:hypothetical protein
MLLFYNRIHPKMLELCCCCLQFCLRKINVTIISSQPRKGINSEQRRSFYAEITSDFDKEGESGNDINFDSGD